MVGLITMKVLFSAILLFAFSSLYAQSYYGVEFIENKGQWKEDYSFKSILGNGVAYFHNNGFTISITHPEDYNRVIERIHGGNGTAQAAGPDNLDPGNGSKDNFSINPVIDPGGQNNSLLLRTHAYRVSFLGSSVASKFIPTNR
jgi:hypothetical protein